MQRAMPLKLCSDDTAVDKGFASCSDFVLNNPKHSELCSISRMEFSGKAFAQ